MCHIMLRVLVWAVIVTNLFYPSFGAIHKVNLGSNTKLSWITHYKTEIVAFEVSTDVNKSAISWLGIGFSDYGELNPSDMCFLWMDWKQTITLQDTWIDTKKVVSVDKKQNCNDFKYHWNKDGKLEFSFIRAFDTCDVDDYVIQDGTTHIVWMKGTGPIFGPEGLNTGSATEKGFERVTLLYYDKPPPQHPKNTRQLDIRAKKTLVPDVETTYWCTVFKLPPKLVKKHHVIQYEKISEPNGGDMVHHMEIFHCATKADEEIPLYEGLCSGQGRPNRTKVCSQVVAAWAMGATPFIYPEEAGLLIGGPDFNPYVMLEIHYHNPKKLSGIFDQSGFRLHLTTSLRKYDAGIIELGLEYNDKMAIPPKQDHFFLTGFCLSECTSVGIPASGITVFGSQLHTHLTGVRVYTQHVRNGVELPELNRDNHYSQHFQEIRRLKHTVTILPGDALLTTCEYQTTDRLNVTLTGFAITDEMCVNYIHYYPRTTLEVCKSSIPDHNLNMYFDMMSIWEGQDTSGPKGISDKYKAIEWNRRRVKHLQNLYLTGPVSMQCNQSSGARFPGGWEGLHPTQILLPLPTKQRKCGLH